MSIKPVVRSVPFKEFIPPSRKGEDLLTSRKNQMWISKARQSNKALGFLVLACLLIGADSACSEEPSSEQSPDLFELSIEQLMEIDVASTATEHDQPRLVPASVTTITEEEIVASGARSLYELLIFTFPTCNGFVITGRRITWVSRNHQRSRRQVSAAGERKEYERADPFRRKANRIWYFCRIFIILTLFAVPVRRCTAPAPFRW